MDRELQIKSDRDQKKLEWKKVKKNRWRNFKEEKKTRQDLQVNENLNEKLFCCRKKSI